MDDHEIVVKPIITEQSTHFANVKNAYSFEVNPKANKIQIKNAIERLYSVKVKDVRTANRKGKKRRRGRFPGPVWQQRDTLAAGGTPRRRQR